jgi:hypothetical protein
MFIFRNRQKRGHLFPQLAKRAHLFQLIRMLGDRVQPQHFRFLSAQLADVSAHLRPVLREVSDK